MATKTIRTLRRGRNASTQFNLMVAGHSHTGKTSFVKTLVETLQVRKFHYNDPETPAGTSIFPKHDIQVPTPMLARIEFDDDTGSERIMLRLIDTPGLPIPVNIHKNLAENYTPIANQWTSGIIKYLEAQYEATLLEESKVKRNPKSPDYQTHLCLYILDPTVCLASNGLTPVDRIALGKLCTRVNVILCLGRADTLSTRQLKSLRQMIMDDAVRNDIAVYMFPDDPEEEFEQDAQHMNAELRSLLPFSIINSEETDGAVGLVSADGNRFLGRQYPWGLVEVDNPEHCDFVKLRQTIFGTHLHELRLLTREVYYEQWRTEKLLEVRGSVMGAAANRTSVPGDSAVKNRKTDAAGYSSLPNTLQRLRIEE
ncbi:hypothetical protein HK102_004363 [Quaeritorhiza haematococci]|nr:hypothetical protein HK102_004363 [Quaeritorhiza haematococci]